MRVGEVSRSTKETQIVLTVNLDGVGNATIHSGLSFFDHLVNSFATHSLIDIDVNVTGDLKHHLMEDVALCLGEALRKALGDGSGVNRFGYAIVPMDCSLAIASVDLVKRPYAKINLKIEGKAIEDTAREDIIHFLETLAASMQANIHVWVLYGKNDHHKVEAAIKALALSMRQAVAVDPRRKRIPSAKGVM
jgi:imidazoleglycerol-phosphate dehydratase